MSQPLIVGRGTGVAVRSNSKVASVSLQAGPAAKRPQAPQLQAPLRIQYQASGPRRNRVDLEQALQVRLPEGPAALVMDFLGPWRALQSWVSSQPVPGAARDPATFHGNRGTLGDLVEKIGTGKMESIDWRALASHETRPDLRDIGSPVLDFLADHWHGAWTAQVPDELFVEIARRKPDILTAEAARQRTGLWTAAFRNECAPVLDRIAEHGAAPTDRKSLFAHMRAVAPRALDDAKGFEASTRLSIDRLQLARDEVVAVGTLPSQNFSPERFTSYAGLVMGRPDLSDKSKLGLMDIAQDHDLLQLSPRQMFHGQDLEQGKAALRLLGALGAIPREGIDQRRAAKHLLGSGLVFGPKFSVAKLVAMVRIKEASAQELANARKGVETARRINLISERHARTLLSSLTPPPARAAAKPSGRLRAEFHGEG